jgi:hypothetical protein
MALEKKMAGLEKGKTSSKASSSCVEAKEEEDSHASDTSTTVIHRRVSGSGGSGSVKARYHELKDFADEIATLDELARLKKDNLMMKKAMNEG